jgi:hypothetical protein
VTTQQTNVTTVVFIAIVTKEALDLTELSLYSSSDLVTSELGQVYGFWVRREQQRGKGPWKHQKVGVTYCGVRL